MLKFLHNFFHFWKCIKTMGANNYYECSFCSKREYSSSIYGYSPLDKKWLNNE